MYTKKVGDNALPSFSWTWREIQYHIGQLIANYCYPRNWPTSSARSDIRKDNRLSLTFGIHPRIVAMENISTLDSWMEQLGHMLNVKGVVAVGECGLDDTGLKERDIKKQEKYFKRQIELAVKKRLPIVIHCRGSKRTDERCLNCLTHFTIQLQDTSPLFQWRTSYILQMEIGFPKLQIWNIALHSIRRKISKLQILSMPYETRRFDC